jgi:hypothetical protein
MLLLFIYNINKSPIGRDNVITVRLQWYHPKWIENHWREFLPHQADLARTLFETYLRQVKDPLINHLCFLEPC